MGHDNTVRLVLGKTVGRAGAEIAMTWHGTTRKNKIEENEDNGDDEEEEEEEEEEELVTDAERFLRWHVVAPPSESLSSASAAVRLSLPGAEIASGDIVRKVELLRRWRREMAMPPRGADLWRGASTLGVYGALPSFLSFSFSSSPSLHP